MEEISISKLKNKYKEDPVAYALLGVAVLIVAVIVFVNQNTEWLDKDKDIFKGYEIDKYTELPEIDITKYNEKTLKEILRINTDQGVHLQQALYIPLASGVTLEALLEGQVPFEQFAKHIQILLDSTSYHIDKYSEFETTDKDAERYHTALLLASRQLHNGLVYYYSSVVEVESEEGVKELEVNTPMYEKGMYMIENYYDYIGNMERVLEYIQKVDIKGLKDYTTKVDDALEQIRQDIEKEIK